MVTGANGLMIFGYGSFRMWGCLTSGFGKRRPESTRARLTGSATVTPALGISLFDRDWDASHGRPSHTTENMGHELRRFDRVKLR